MIILQFTEEVVRLIGLLPTLVLASSIGLAACQVMFVALGIAGPPEDQDKSVTVPHTWYNMYNQPRRYNETKNDNPDSSEGPLA